MSSWDEQAKKQEMIEIGGVVLFAVFLIVAGIVFPPFGCLMLIILGISGFLASIPFICYGVGRLSIWAFTKFWDRYLERLVRKFAPTFKKVGSWFD